MTRANLHDTPKIGGKKSRFTGRGSKPRAGIREETPAKKVLREPCPKSRAKQRYEECETE